MIDRAGFNEAGPVSEPASAFHLDASRARGMSVWFGLLFYTVPVVALLGGLHALIRAVGGSGLPFGAGVAAALAVMAVVIGRGLTMSGEISADGMRVRNRWRSVRVPWNDIEEVAISTAGPYAVADLVDDVISMSRAGGEHHELTDGGANDVLAITRRGCRRRLKVYASMGFTADEPTRRHVEDALRARGATLVDPVPRVSRAADES